MKDLSTPFKKKVAVLIPTYKVKPDVEEQISKAHLKAFLNRHDVFYVAPSDLKIESNDYPVKRFDRKFFQSVESYNKLMLSEHFYETFFDYKYILIYQLDSLVFSDQLHVWCDKGYDYIGAPWLVCPELPWLQEDAVGNGGFSLRKVAACLEVLRQYHAPLNRLKRMCVFIYRIKQRMTAVGKRVTFAGIARAIREEVESLKIDFKHEDIFWSFEAKKYHPDFKIPDVETALNFAFEVNPRLCWEKNGHRLPFGCHAWAKYDRVFWEEQLLKVDGYSV